MANPHNRASYQHVNNINNRPFLSPVHRKTLADIATQAALVADSRTASSYHLRNERLRGLIRSLPKSL